MLALLGLSWTQYVDDLARVATQDHFKRALAVAAVARGFNGIISVAQGTEVAVAPVGVGVTLTIGEILDPLNDLVERFSALALLASVALGIQLSLGEMLSSAWVSGALSLLAIGYLVLLWRPGPAPSTPFKAQRWLSQGLALMIFFRFMLAGMLLVTHVLDSQFLAKQQDQALENLTLATSNIEELQAQNQAAATAYEEQDLFERTASQLKQWVDASKQTLDLKTNLAALEEQVENSVEEMIKLIVIFLLQTILLPIGSLWLSWRLLQGFWRNRELSKS